MLIEELIFEKSRASLYHFTDVYESVQILKSDSLRGDLGKNNPTKKLQNTVSFTRLKNSNKGLFQGHKVRLEFDQDKLKTKYRIMPHNDNYDSEFWDNPDMFNSFERFMNRQQRKFEAEEYVLGNVEPVSNFLMSIKIMGWDHVHTNIILRNMNLYAYLANHKKIDSGDKQKIIDILNRFVVDKSYLGDLGRVD